MSNENRPVVPNGPTRPADTSNNAPVAAATEESEKQRGGRRPYSEILQETEELAKRVEELKTALLPFARIPDDGAKKAEDVLYRLAREDGKADIKCGDIRRARRAIGLP
jgi:hypothetical protein